MGGWVGMIRWLSEWLEVWMGWWMEYNYYMICRASLEVQMVKNPPAMWDTRVQSLGWEDPVEEGMATHSSILAWRIPMDRGAWWATVHRVTKSWTERLSTHSTGIAFSLLGLRFPSIMEDFTFKAPPSIATVNAASIKTVSNISTLWQGASPGVNIMKWLKNHVKICSTSFLIIL